MFYNGFFSLSGAVLTQDIRGFPQHRQLNAERAYVIGTRSLSFKLLHIDYLLAVLAFECILFERLQPF
jgi:hypothetical protein